jgi:hypothetical protein
MILSPDLNPRSYRIYRLALGILLLLLLAVSWNFLPRKCRAQDTQAAATSSPRSDHHFLRSVENLMGTDWYGIDFQGKKVGHATMSFRRENTSSGPEFHSDLSAHIILHTLGNAVQLTMDLSWRFDGRPPYLLIEYMDQMQSGNDVAGTQIERHNQTYRARIQQANEIRSKILQSFELKLSDVLAVETWLQQSPRIGERIRFADLDTQTLTIGDASAKILNIETTVVNGIEMTYFTVLQKLASGPEMMFLYGTNGKPYTMTIGEAFKFQLEPKQIALKPDQPIDLFLFNIVRVDTEKGFYPHAWNEVVLGSHWHPVDPTWGQTTIDATHIRFSVDENEMFQIIGAVPNMKIVVLEFVTRDEV